MREMKPKIGEGILKEHLAVLKERKSPAADGFYPRERSTVVLRGQRSLRNCVHTGDGPVSSQFSKMGRSHSTGLHPFLLKIISG